MTLDPPVDPLPARRPSILFVEDNLDNQLVTSMMLEALGYSADVATDGEHALELHRERGHDVVLMDLTMPRIDGFEATRRLRERTGDARRPWIVAVTARAFDGDGERCIESGMNDYVTKPMDLESLEAALERASAAIFGVP